MMKTDSYPIDPKTGLIQVPKKEFQSWVLHSPGGIRIPTLREITMLVADVQVDKKVREHGSNRGPEVEAYLQETGLGPGNPWCAAFVNWCARHAADLLDVPSPLEDVPLQAYVQSYVDFGRKRGWLIPADHARHGDLFCLYYGSLGRYGHIGFVDTVDLINEEFTTLEGNTGSGGTREGDGAYARTRNLTQNILFLRWTE